MTVYNNRRPGDSRKRKRERETERKREISSCVNLLAHAKKRITWNRFPGRGSAGAVISLSLYRGLSPEAGGGTVTKVWEEEEEEEEGGGSAQRAGADTMPRGFPGHVGNAQ